MTPEVSWSVAVDGLLAVGVERVWRALTLPDELTRWFVDHAEVSAEPDRVVLLQWTQDASGVDRTIAGQWTTWDPPQTLSLSFVDDESPQSVTWTLTPYHGGTRLVVTHQGRGPVPDTALAIQRGWQHALANLRCVVDDDGERIPTLVYYREQGWL